MFSLSKRRVGLAIERSSITLVKLEGRRGRFVLKGCERRPFSFTLEGESEQEAKALAHGDLLTEVMGEMFQTLNVKGAEVGLALPDPMVHLSFVELKGGKRTKGDEEQQIRFRLRKALPYDISQARIAFQMIDEKGQGNGSRALVISLPEAAVSSYERSFESLSLKPKTISMTSIMLNNLFRQSMEPALESACLYLLGDYFSVLIFEGSSPTFFRTKQTAAGDDLIPNIYATFLYYYRLNPKVRLKKVHVFSALGPLEEQDSLLGQALDAEIVTLDVTQALKLEPGPAIAPGLLEPLGPALAAALN